MSLSRTFITIASQRQTTLDGSLVRQPRVPPFTPQGLIDHLVQLIVTEDEAFYLLDKPAFRELLVYIRPTLAESDIPHRTKIREQVLARAGKAESTVKAALQVRSAARHVIAMRSADLYYKRVEGDISFTFDTWTSDPGHNYISVTAHYIDSPKDHPDEWTLREVQLAFALLEGHHTGANIASVLSNVLDRYEIREKVRIVFMLCAPAN
jgi:hypothetical protein